jgi:proline racemase
MHLSRLIPAVDAHACGEPGRVIIGGVFGVPGETIFAKKLYLEEHGDHLRKLMLREPRGYPALCCNLILPAADPRADIGFLIMEQTEYPPMSGSNTICVVTVLIETGMVRVEEPVTRLTLDTAAGLVKISAEVSNGKVTQVTFENQPAFAVYLDRWIEVPGLGSVKVDVAYGGMWYVMAEAQQFGLALTPDEGRAITQIGERVKAAAREQLPVAHPDNEQIEGISISQLFGPAHTPGAHGRNAVIVSSKPFDPEAPHTWSASIDRSPCGTGTCARMAALHAKGQLRLNDGYVHESILGTRFTGRLIEETVVGPYRAVVPTISGRAWITGFANYVLDPSDPFPEGFTVGDIW